MMKRVVEIFLIIMVPFLAAGNYYFFKNKDEGGVLIRDVIDGDTMVMETGGRIRLVRGDAPELRYCMGEESKKELEKLVKGKKVRLREEGGDNFGRIIALVYVGDKLVNEEMLKLGLLRYQGGPSDDREKMQAAADFARENNLGIYSSECRQTENLDDPDCLIKGNIDKNNGNKIYHFDGCSGYEGVVVEKDLGEEWFCSEKEAEAAGYRKSEQCFGKRYNLN